MTSVGGNPLRAQVQCRFNVRLRAPVCIGYDIQPEDFESLSLRVGDSYVVIRPAETVPVGDDPESLETPGLSQLAVWVTRDTELSTDDKGTFRVSAAEKDNLEDVLLETITRLIRALKRRTRQWHLDTRYPVSFYRCTLFYQDTELEEFGALPDYVKRSITFRDLLEPMPPETWNELAGTLDNSAPLPAYYELLCDAKVFRSQLRYNDSVLYAAIACELTLEHLHAETLAGGVPSVRHRKKPERSGGGSLTQEIRRLAPSIGLNWDDLESLFHHRNAVAHGDPVSLDRRDADQAISTAEAVVQILDAGHIA